MYLSLRHLYLPSCLYSEYFTIHFMYLCQVNLLKCFFDPIIPLLKHIDASQLCSGEGTFLCLTLNVLNILILISLFRSIFSQFYTYLSTPVKFINVFFLTSSCHFSVSISVQKVSSHFLSLDSAQSSIPLFKCCAFSGLALESCSLLS